MRKRLIGSALVAGCSLLAGLALSASPALAAGDANEASCPNEALSGFSVTLPDCRAYEQVSPVFKGGFAFGYNFSLAGGGLVDGHSLGSPDGGNPPFGPASTQYASARTESGWVIEPLGVAFSSGYTYGEYGAGLVAEASLSESGASVLSLRPLQASVYEDDLYVRAQGGSLQKIGAMLPPSALSPQQPTGTTTVRQGWEGGGHILDATPDLSHVLFSLNATTGLEPGMTNNLWPGDETVKSSYDRPSLYEYVAGSGASEPALVGVRNEGALDGSPHLNEGAELISQCETGLGGVNGSAKHNAISTDGSIVFFGAGGTDEAPCGGLAPPVGELFARIDGSHTVPISEPRALSPTAPDPGCISSECQKDIGEEANFSGADFEGASADGSKVFFTSTQRLLDGATQDGEDSATRGGCQQTTGANGCNLYEYEGVGSADGHLVLLSGGDSSGLGVGGPQVQGVAALSEDGSRVYFVAKGVLTKELNTEGREAQAGAENLYLKDTTSAGPPIFIATLATADSFQWQKNYEFPMDVTADGRFLVFTSRERLTPDDTSTVAQVFRYDAGAGSHPPTLVRVSAGDEGYGDDGNTSAYPAVIDRTGLEGGQGGMPIADKNLHPAVAEDGTVVFESADTLTPHALKAECLYEEAGNCYTYSQNVYEYREGRVHLISDGLHPATGGWISQSGTDIFFQTGGSLVAQDTDVQQDVYDARVAGGFPVSATAKPCAGEGCQGEAGAAPVFGAPASTTISGSGNLAPVAPAVKPGPKAKPAKCRRGFVKRRGRCVEKPAARRRVHRSKGRSRR